MIDLDQLSPADLSALLCSRICHDIISPVGAINNGLELLEEEGADESAMELIRSSAQSAAARLQFFRIAFGAAGSAGVQIDTGDAEAVAKTWIACEKPELTWSCDRALLPKNKVKLILNMLVLGNASIPRGGELDCTVDDALTDAPKVTVTAKGRMMRVPQAFQDMVDGRKSEDPVDAHAVQFYYTLLLSRETGMALDIDMTDDAITYRAA
jgi:histidine phosphotransferase ChpT